MVFINHFTSILGDKTFFIWWYSLKLISWGAIHIFWSLILRFRCWVEGISDARRDLLWNGYGMILHLGKKGESDQLIRDENRYTSGIIWWYQSAQFLITNIATFHDQKKTLFRASTLHHATINTGKVITGGSSKPKKLLQWIQTNHNG